MTRHILKIVWNRKKANVLIVTEIFLSFLVLFAVLTLATAIVTSVRKPLGFEWRNVWNISVETNRASADVAASHQQNLELMMRELETFPQIEAVAASLTPPYAMSSFDGPRTIDGKNVFVTQDFVDDGFADVMQVELIAGRWFSAVDDAASYEPIVIDADLARAVYGDENAVGRRFADGSKQERRVVGVVAPYRKTGEFANFGRPINMMFARAATTRAETFPDNILIRLRPGTPASFEKTLSDRLHQVAPAMNFRIRHMSRMREFAHRTVLLPLVLLAAIATFLISMVVLGLSGVLWQNVTRRRQEIGLRRAIGATGPAVQRQIVGEVVILTTLAVVVGIAIVAQLPLLGLLTLIQPAAFIGGIIGSLVAIYGLTVLCGMYPGWLASRVQPAQALHYE